jgi:hypothetical protein
MMTWKVWFELVMRTLEHISNREIQKKAWVLRTCTTFTCYDELICWLYDDADFERFIEEAKKQSYLSKSALNELVLFEKKLSEFLKNPDKDDDAWLLKDPEWHEINLLAKKLLDTLKSELEK